ncbi:MAG: glycosyltransferase family 2 protein [Deltaproteobacteria bacterium]|nr:glycosyltransferase family 2 protein [Deltaproteobacteria bacterium]
MHESPTPAVTVIVPTYNSSGALRMSLETVLRQDFADFEVWVIGDGCTDDSASVVRSFGDDRVHWTNLPVNSGAPAAPRNEGLRRARGKYVAYLGHDDLWFPWHLSGLMESIEKDGGDFAYSLGALIGPEGVVGVFSLPESPWNKRSAISPSNWMHRTSLAEHIGLWSTTIRIGDDRDFLRRAYAANTRFCFFRQLSVLKYPSLLWRTYSLTSAFPQSGRLEAIRRTPEALRLELLQEVAEGMAKWGYRLGPQSSPCRKPLRWLVSLCMDAYGRHRWPLNRLLYWSWSRASGLSEKKRNPE